MTTRRILANAISLPVIFWSSIIIFMTTAFCSFGVNTWAQYVGLRAVEGFFGSAATLIGIQIIYDMYARLIFSGILNLAD